MLFLAIEHQLDRRARGFRELRANQAFRAQIQFAAEATAHVLSDDADIRLRNAETVRKVAARGRDALRRHPGGQLVAFPFADRAVRLETRVRDDVRCVSLVERLRCGFEPGSEIARLLRLTRPYVAALEHRRGRARERLV